MVVYRRRGVANRCRRRRRSARDWAGRHLDSSATTCSSCRRCCHPPRHIWSTDLFPASTSFPLEHHRKTTTLWSLLQWKPRFTVRWRLQSLYLADVTRWPLHAAATWWLCDAAAATPRLIYASQDNWARACARPAIITCPPGQQLHQARRWDYNSDAYTADDRHV